MLSEIIKRALLNDTTIANVNDKGEYLDVEFRGTLAPVKVHVDLKVVYFVVGYAEGNPAAYWTISPYRAYTEKREADLIAESMNERAFDKDTGFRFRVERLEM